MTKKETADFVIVINTNPNLPVKNRRVLRSIAESKFARKAGWVIQGDAPEVKHINRTRVDAQGVAAKTSEAPPSEAKAWDVTVLNLTAAKAIVQIEKIIDLNYLDALLQAEEAGKGRLGLLKAIRAQLKLQS